MCRRHDLQWPKVIAAYSWGSGGALISPVGPEQSPGGGSGGKGSGRTEDLAFYNIQKKAEKSLVLCIFLCIALCSLNTGMNSERQLILVWFAWLLPEWDFCLFKMIFLLQDVQDHWHQVKSWLLHFGGENMHWSTGRADINFSWTLPLNKLVINKNITEFYIPSKSDIEKCPKIRSKTPILFWITALKF